MVSNPARLKIENDMLVVAQQEEIPLPLEDIGVLMLESPQILLSAAVLARLAEHGGTLIACGPNHLPILAGLPFAGHSRLAGVQRMQLDTTQPFRKRCWQLIVRAKICNQAKCLGLLGREGADHLSQITDDVTSGDTANVESAAAHYYFPSLFGHGFDRRSESFTNSALNYGYAVVRAAIARALAAHGFLLTQGIHHSNELNAFNLADDFLEPFRPVVDLLAATLTGSGELDSESRRRLVGLLACEVCLDGEAQPVLHAADLMAASFSAACREGEPKRLLMPGLLPLRQHEYE